MSKPRRSTVRSGYRHQRMVVSSLGFCCLALAAILGRMVCGDDRGTRRDFASASAGIPPGSEPSSTGDRIREGTPISKQLGYFKVTGDRLTFISADGTRRLGGLENLALERIAKLVSESPDPLQWSVTGVVTEYQGANYLLVTQAVLKSKATRRGGLLNSESPRTP